MRTIRLMLLAKIPREEEISHNVDSWLKLGVNATEVSNCTAVRKTLVDTDGPNCLGYKIDEKRRFVLNDHRRTRS